MKKSSKILASIVAILLLTIALLNTAVFAEGPEEIGDEANLIAALGADAQGINGEYNLTTTIETASKLAVASGSNVVLHLNGNELIIPDQLEVRGHLFVTGPGSIRSKSGAAIRVFAGGELGANSATITSDAGVGVYAEGGMAILTDCLIQSKESGVCAKAAGWAEIHGGTVTTQDNFAVGTNGTQGLGENTIIIDGASLNSNITSGGYISCGVYVANTDNVEIRSGTTITAGPVSDKGGERGAGVVIRGGNVTIDQSVIDSMVVGSASGQVGDSHVPVSGKVIIDGESNYPGIDSINLNIEYNTETDGVESSTTTLQNILKQEIKTNALLKNIDVTSIKIEAEEKTVAEDAKNAAIEGAKNLFDGFKNGKAIDLSVAIKTTADDGVVAQLSTTTEPVPFKVDVSDIAVDANLNYAFQVIREHNDGGSVSYENLPCTYNASSKTIEFSSDKFSTYLINYKTTAKPATEPAKSNGSEAPATPIFTGGGEPAPAGIAATGTLDAEPKAGEVTLLPVAILSVISLAVVAIIKK